MTEHTAQNVNCVPPGLNAENDPPRDSPILFLPSRQQFTPGRHITKVSKEAL
jgi:hypothetical protein